MKYINSSFEEINIDENLCLSIGNFDGIHKGHREIIKNLIQKKKKAKNFDLFLSISDEKDYSIAFTVIQKI